MFSVSQILMIRYQDLRWICVLCPCKNACTKRCCHLEHAGLALRFLNEMCWCTDFSTSCERKQEKQTASPNILGLLLGLLWFRKAWFCSWLNAWAALRSNTGCFIYSYAGRRPSLHVYIHKEGLQLNCRLQELLEVKAGWINVPLTT